MTDAKCSIWQNDRAVIIKDEMGNKTIPSYVAFPDSKSMLVGHEAKNHMHLNSSTTIYDLLRILGKKSDDPTLQKDSKDWKFKMIPDQTGKPKILVNYKEETSFFIEEIISFLFLQLKKNAQKYLRVNFFHLF